MHNTLIRKNIAVVLLVSVFLGYSVIASQPFSGNGKRDVLVRYQEIKADHAYDLILLLIESDTDERQKIEDSVMGQINGPFFGNESVVTAIETCLRTVKWKAQSEEIAVSESEVMLSNLKRIAVLKQREILVRIDEMPSPDSLNMGLPADQSDRYDEKLNSEIEENNRIASQLIERSHLEQFSSRLKGIIDRLSL